MSDSRQRRVVVTGASSGIGKAIALRYAREGYRVCLASDDRQGLEEVERKLEGKGHCIFTFTAEDSSWETDLSVYIKGELGDVDVLVNSMGRSESLDIIDSGLSTWDQVMQINFYGVMKVCRTIVPLMSNGGRIINITSIHSDRVEIGNSSYAASKAALESFTKSMALELAPKKILANCIAPGFIDTPMSVKKGVNELDTDWFKDNYLKYDHLPLKRPGKPEEVAGLAYFLSTEDADYITGASLVVDGGLSITF